jgi:1,4-dihydroxy-2-naphthoate polyprenyltransferase
MNAWLKAARPLAHANIAPPLWFGQALAFAIHGTFDLGIFVWVAIFGVFDHLFIVFANDAADWRADLQNTTYNRFSGGSRVVPDGKLTPRDLAFAALVCVVGMAMVSVALVFRERRALMMVATSFAVGIFWAYSFAPLRLSYRGFGEWLQGLGVGVLLPLIGYYAQSGEFLSIPGTLVVAGFLLGWAGNLVTALPDTPSDRISEKRSFPVRRGQTVAARAAVIAIATASVLMAFEVGARGPSLMIAVALPPLLALLVAIRLLPHARAENHVACEHFVAASGGAIVLAWLSATAVLALAQQS